VEKLPAIIGRRKDVQVCLDNPWVSRRHCELDEVEGILLVRDLGSRNGTFVNGYRISASPLMPGDELNIAGVTFLVEYEPCPRRLPGCSNTERSGDLHPTP
jgi:pSer/pThr/pTyr-binding forkhead associated (FHA) protein